MATMTKIYVSPDGQSSMPVDSPIVEARMKARGWTEKPQTTTKTTAPAPKPVPEPRTSTD
jgi:hypothetical protein